MTLEAFVISMFGIGIFLAGMYDCLEATYARHDEIGLLTMILGVIILAVGLSK